MAHFSLILSSSSLQRLLVVTAVLSWRYSSVMGQRLRGCPVSRLHILSYNETLLPRSTDNIRPQIQFNSGPLVATSFVNYGPNHTDVWCAPELESIPEPFISLVFTEPVVVVGIISGGYTYQTPNLDGFREYVSSFTLEYTLTDQNDDFMLHRANLSGSGETEFVIDDDNVDQLVVLQEPFSALRVRLQVMDRTRSDFVNITCWSMAILGCAASEAIYEETAQPPVTDPIPIEVTVTETRVTTRTVFVTPSSSCMPDTGPTVETITVSVSIPSSNCTPSVTAAASGGQATQQAASVAIPVALVTVVTIVIVVVVGVIVCIKRGRGKLASDIRSSRHTSEPTDVHYVNTGIGRVRIGDGNTDSLRERTVTIKEVENELYQLQLNDNRQTDSAIYEAIPSSTAHNTVKGNGVVNGSPAGPLASSTDPPPYSLLAMASPPPSAAVRGPSQPVAVSSSLMSDLIDNQNYGKFESDVYTVPFSPMKEITAGRGKEQFQLSRNESYGSLPTTPLPHYATPTSTLRYIPEMEANAQPQANSDDYEPMILLPGAMTSSDGTPLS